MSTLVIRTTAPTTNNPFYYSNNIFYQCGYGLPNCTAYAWGRAFETWGERPKLSTGNAEKWWSYSDGYARGQVPRIGSIMVWEGLGSAAGHVCFVEDVYSDGSVLTTHSAWQSTFFWTQTIEAPYYFGSGYRFLGFIYPPIDFDSDDLTPISKNAYLTLEEMKINAKYIYRYFSNHGWTLNAVAGMLGNMETESTINAGIWESLDEGNTSNGFGLVQWTPATKLIEWCESNNLAYDNIDSQLQRILYELENNIQYMPTSSYLDTFKEFSTSTKTPEYLAQAFLLNYERPADQNQPNRSTQARFWYDYLSNYSTGDLPLKSKKISLLLMYMATRKMI